MADQFVNRVCAGSNRVHEQLGAMSERGRPHKYKESLQFRQLQQEIRHRDPRHQTHHL